MMRHRLARTAVLAVTLATLAACGGAPSPTAAQTSGRSEGVQTSKVGTGDRGRGLQIRALLASAAPLVTTGTATATPVNHAMAALVTASPATAVASTVPSVTATASLATASPAATPTDASDPAWIDADLAAVFQAGTCPDPSTRSAPERPVFACDRDGVRYLLGPAELFGPGIFSEATAAPQIDASGAQSDNLWQVELKLAPGAASRLATMTTRLSGLQGDRARLAVLDGSLVVTAPSVTEPLTAGVLQITGNFSRQDAEALRDAVL